MENRIIKFRGVNKFNKEFVEGNLIQGVGYNKGDLYILPNVINLANVPGCHPLNGCNVFPETVGQFTGLLDKNSKEIFEGDKLRSGDEDSLEEHYQVAWNSEYARFQLDLYSYAMHHNEGGGEEYNTEVSLIDENAMDMDCVSEFEISGNIYIKTE